MPIPALFKSSSLAPVRMLALVLTCTARASLADCVDDAAARHQVNALVLRAIGWQESRLEPHAVAHNANGSIDVGAFQINSIHLPELARYGIDSAALGDGCVNADVAAWHYRRQVDQQGDTWLAVGRYHSHTSARAAWYANQVAAILMRWNVMPAGPLPFPAAPPPAHAPLPPAVATSAAAAPVVYSAIAFVPPAH